MTYTADRRLYATRDGQVVEEGDPKAAVLIATPGTELSDAEVERYGLVKPKSKSGPPATKHVKGPPQNK